MKKQLSFLFCTLFTALFLNAQTNTFPSTGNVGIGTSSPNTVLHVEKNSGALLKLSNDLNNYLYSGIDGLGAYFEQVANTSGKSKIRLQTRNSNQGTYSQFFIDGGNSHFSFLNGEVGIGTTSPGAKLHIVDQGTSGVTTLQLNSKIKFRGDGVMEWGVSSNQGLLSWDTGRAVVGAKSGQDLSLYANQSEKIRIKSNGNIGVGLNNPDYLFQIHNANRPTLAIGKLNENTNGQSKLAFFAGTSTHKNGYSITYTKNDITDRLGFFDGSGTERVSFLSGGNVGIGTTDTKGFKLGVNGKIAATEVKVATYANWADFVFNKGYKLPTLKEVENHIKEHGHLKDIPNAEEVKKDGFYLAEMNAKLLQKIEELTLYTIEQEKSLDNKDSKIRNLEEKLKSQEARLKKVEALLAIEK